MSKKVVLITGSSSGIGSYLAINLAKLNCKLILCGTNKGRLDQVKEKCLDLMTTGNASDVLVLAFDLSDFDSHRRCFDRAIKHFGRIDILINNAGKSQRAEFEKIDLTVDKKLFDINVFGPLNLTRLVLNHWYKQNYKGQIVVISSTAGIVGIPFSASYTASKHALHGYFETLRLEGYDQGVRVTIVCPGPVYSNIGYNALTEKLDTQAKIIFPENKKRVRTQRCAFLILVAIANELDVVWISLNPVLLLHYLNQYFPTLNRLAMCKLFNLNHFRILRDSR